MEFNRSNNEKSENLESVEVNRPKTVTIMAIKESVWKKNGRMKNHSTSLRINLIDH